MAQGWREHGSRPGSGGVASNSAINSDRRERLRQLAMETIDLQKDPYFMKNHLGTFECKLCLTLHKNEGSYLAHTQGRRHQMNLSRRAAREQRSQMGPQPILAAQSLVKTPKASRKHRKKIGVPGYRVIKERDTSNNNNQLSLLFVIDYPEIEEGIKPRYRFMSSFEQNIEAPNKNYQYLIIAAEPYENIGFKIPNKEVERTVGPEIPGESKFWTNWEEDSCQFQLQLCFKPDVVSNVSARDHKSDYAYFQQ